MADQTVHARRCRKDDVSAIVRLLWDDEIGATREDSLDTALAGYQDAPRAVSDDPNGTIFVAEAEGRLAGCLQVTLIPGLSYRGARRALIEDVRVERDRRGAGIGAGLVGAAEHHAAEHGCQIVELFVHSDRPDAHRFYERLGYAGRHRGFRKTLPREPEP